MKKPRLLVDFDNTLVASIPAFCKTYNNLFKRHPEFKPADPSKVERYDLTCQCPLLGEKGYHTLRDIFENVSFFTDLEFINENTYNVLKQLSEKYTIVIHSIGTPDNLNLKLLWLQTFLPFVENYILIYNGNLSMNKSTINAGKDDVFIDDIPSNLRSANAGRKILFGERYLWNEDWDGEHCLTWDDVLENLQKGD